MQNISEYVKEQCKDDSTGHDWWHINRVVKLALYIGKKENANLQLVELAALLHDLDDWKISSGNEEYQNARKALSIYNIDKSISEQVIEIIKQVSFKGAGVDTTPRTIEAKVVQDADRLDAIGAIGVARTFAYGGSKQNLIYDPDLEPILHNDFNHYKSSKGTTINHFYEKLLLLKDRLNTLTAKQLAENRHQFMEKFLEQFFSEWNGKGLDE
jgi:uncharacterized protein